MACRGLLASLETPSLQREHEELQLLKSLLEQKQIILNAETTLEELSHYLQRFPELHILLRPITLYLLYEPLFAGDQRLYELFLLNSKPIEEE